MPKPKERYCVHGHDTHVVGRDAHYRCKECRRIQDRDRARARRVTGRPKERFCKRGHDTHKVGRVPNNGWCRTCARLAETNGGRIPEPGSQSRPKTHPAEWEAARVRAWLAIVAHDKMIENKCTQQRKKDFDKRYEKLEAAVPTPVDA